MNVAKSGGTLHDVLETGLALKADAVLIQEPPSFQKYSHPSFHIIWGKRTATAIRILSGWTPTEIEELEKESEGDIQVIDFRRRSGLSLRIVNVYDQRQFKDGSQGKERPA